MHILDTTDSIGFQGGSGYISATVLALFISVMALIGAQTNRCQPFAEVLDIAVLYCAYYYTQQDSFVEALLWHKLTDITAAFVALGTSHSFMRFLFGALCYAYYYTKRETEEDATIKSSHFALYHLVKMSKECTPSS